MALAEKQFGVRLKDPALSIIEKRAEQIQITTPEVKITTGGVARYAVEQYAEQLDRKVIETQLSFQYVGLQTLQYLTKEEILQQHPYLTEDDFKINYSYDELEKLTLAFENIAEVLSSKELIPKDKSQKWKNVSSDLRWNFNQWKSGLEEAQERENEDW